MVSDIKYATTKQVQNRNAREASLGEVETIGYQHRKPTNIDKAKELFNTIGAGVKQAQSSLPKQSSNAFGKSAFSQPKMGMNFNSPKMNMDFSPPKITGFGKPPKGWRF